MRRFVLMVALIIHSPATADEGTARHVLVGFGSTLACSYFLKGLFRLEQDEKWKSSIICLGGLIATSALIEAAQAQERKTPLDVGDMANSAAGGMAATGLYLAYPF
jgi:CHASE1-domain containing sensor protein